MIAGIIIGFLFFIAVDVYIAIELARMNREPGEIRDGQDGEDE